MASNLTDVDAFTSPIVVPDPGDDRKAASVITGFQALADRTRNLKNRLDGLDAANHGFTGTVGLFHSPEAAVVGGAANEIVYGDNLGVPTPRTRVIYLPLSAGFQFQGGSDWSRGSDGSLVCTAATKDWLMFPRLPTGFVVTKAELSSAELSYATATAHMELGVQLITQDAAGGPPTAGGETVAHHGVVASPEILTVTGSWTLSNLAQLRFRIRSSDAINVNYGGANWLRLTVGDPGPRNY